MARLGKKFFRGDLKDDPRVEFPGIGSNAVETGCLIPFLPRPSSVKLAGYFEATIRATW
jgi:hypothetical protein